MPESGRAKTVIIKNTRAILSAPYTWFVPIKAEAFYGLFYWWERRGLDCAVN
jgi:hypothetical protein